MNNNDVIEKCSMAWKPLSYLCCNMVFLDGNESLVNWFRLARYISEYRACYMKSHKEAWMKSKQHANLQRHIPNNKHTRIKCN